jgi:hypothetical protein
VPSPAREVWLAIRRIEFVPRLHDLRFRATTEAKIKQSAIRRSTGCPPPDGSPSTGWLVVFFFCMFALLSVVSVSWSAGEQWMLLSLRHQERSAEKKIGGGEVACIASPHQRKKREKIKGGGGCSGRDRQRARGCHKAPLPGKEREDKKIAWGVPNHHKVKKKNKIPPTCVTNNIPRQTGEEINLQSSRQRAVRQNRHDTELQALIMGRSPTSASSSRGVCVPDVTEADLCRQRGRVSVPRGLPPLSLPSSSRRRSATALE